MINEVSVIALFCEDIREEKGGTDTIIGVLPDNLRVPSLPGMLPKLCIYIRTNIRPDFNAGAFAARIMMPGGKEVSRSEATLDVVDEVRRKAEAKGAPYAGFITKFVFAPLPINEAGRILVVLTISGVEHVAGALNVELAAQDVT